MSYNCEILADSICNGSRLTTFKVTYPRIIHAEMCRHRMLSRNTASSRAIPFEKMVKDVQENPFIPIAWQKNHKGMQGTEYWLKGEKYQFPILGYDRDAIELNTGLWKQSMALMVSQAKYLNNSGKGNVTKQLCNRLLEPFAWVTEIISGTEWENFFNLRCPAYECRGRLFKSKRDLKVWAEDLMYNSYSELDWLQINKSQADIHIQAIAELMWDEINLSVPKVLKSGEWHIPFGDNFDNYGGQFVQYLMKKWQNKQAPTDGNLWERIKIATARCARISYETLGDTPKIDYEADIRLHDRLADMKHWSPFEHVAKAMNKDEYNSRLYKSNGEAGWCRNYRGFIPYRHLVEKDLI
jgi:thymidylate synthase ThyX